MGIQTFLYSVATVLIVETLALMIATKWLRRRLTSTIREGGATPKE